MVDQYEHDREQLRAIQQVFEKAVEHNTLEDLQDHVDPDFSMVSFTDKSFDDFASFQAQWKITRQKIVGNGSFITHLNPEPSLFIGDIAICKGQSDNAMVEAKGARFDYTSHWTVIFKRHDSGWKILRAHNSLDPFANPMLISNVKRRVIAFSTFAFVLGGLTCSVLAYIITA